MKHRLPSLLPDAIILSSFFLLSWFSTEPLIFLFLFFIFFFSYSRRWRIKKIKFQQQFHLNILFFSWNSIRLLCSDHLLCWVSLNWDFSFLFFILYVRILYYYCHEMNNTTLKKCSDEGQKETNNNKERDWWILRA